MSVKHTLLALLYQHPMHGYELGKQLNLVINAEWDVKPGQIASTLARLKDANLVDYEIEQTDDAPDRKVYCITDEGRRELESWYRTPEVREYRLGDAFYIKLVLSLVGGPVIPEQVLMIQRRELYQQLHEATELSRQTDPQDSASLAAAAGKRHHAPRSRSALDRNVRSAACRSQELYPAPSQRPRRAGDRAASENPGSEPKRSPSED